MFYIHLTLQVRFDISHLKGAVSLREIGRCLGRSHTSINRELKCNGSSFSGLEYGADRAHDTSQRRQSMARHHRRQDHAPLLRYVERRLVAGGH